MCVCVVYVMNMTKPNLTNQTTGDYIHYSLYTNCQPFKKEPGVSSESQ